MPVEDYLMPGEEIRFQSSKRVRYGEKPYRVVVTDRRIILYAERGLMFRTADVVSQKIDELQAIRYTEQGIIDRRGTIHIEGRTKLNLGGSATEIKILYQQLMQFM